MTRRYTIVIERATHNYAAYAPDVPGYITTGPTVEATIRNMIEALTAHLEVTREYGEPLPEPVTGTAAVTPLSPDDLITTVAVDVPEAAPLPG